MGIESKALELIKSLTESQFKEYFDESKVYLVKNCGKVDSYGSKASLMISTGSTSCDLEVPAEAWRGVAIISKDGSILLQDTLENVKSGKIRELTLELNKCYQQLSAKYSEAELASFGYQFNAIFSADRISNEILERQITTRMKYSSKYHTSQEARDKVGKKSMEYYFYLAELMGTYQGLVDQVEASQSNKEVESIVWPEIGAD